MRSDDGDRPDRQSDDANGSKSPSGERCGIHLISILKRRAYPGTSTVQAPDYRGR